MLSAICWIHGASKSSKSQDFKICFRVFSCLLEGCLMMPEAGQTLTGPNWNVMILVCDEY